MRVAPQLLVTGAPASDDPNDESGCIHVELRYDAALRRIAAEQASRRSDGNNETATVEQQTRRPSSAAPVLLLRKEPYLRTAGSRPGSAARRAPLRPAEGVTDEPMNSCAGGETPPQPPAQSRPSSAQHHTARCSSCALAHASAHAPARPQRPGSASSARRGSAVTRTTSVPALQLGRLHGYMDSRVHPDVFAPRSPRIQLLPRPLSAAARAERPRAAHGCGCVDGGRLHARRRLPSDQGGECCARGPQEAELGSHLLWARAAAAGWAAG